MSVSINTAVFENEVKQNGKSQLDCLNELVGQPIDAIEVRGEFFNEATKIAELTAIQQLCVQNNWQLFYSVPEEMFHENQINEQLSDYLKMANDFNITNLKFSLGDLNFNDMDQLNDTCQTLEMLLASTLTTVTIENQPNDNGKMPQFLTKIEYLAKTVTHLGYTFDSGNWYWINQQPEQAYKQLAQYTTIFHLKNVHDRQTTMLADGDTDWQQLSRMTNPVVPVFLEYNIPTNLIASEIKLVNDFLEAIH